METIFHLFSQKISCYMDWTNHIRASLLIGLIEKCLLCTVQNLDVYNINKTKNWPSIYILKHFS